MQKPLLQQMKFYSVGKPMLWKLMQMIQSTMLAEQSDHTAFGDFTDGEFFTMDSDATIAAGSALEVKHALGSGQTYRSYCSC